MRKKKYTKKQVAVGFCMDDSIAQRFRLHCKNGMLNQTAVIKHLIKEGIEQDCIDVKTNEKHWARINIRMDQDLFDQLQAYAKQKNRNQSDVVTLLIENYLEREGS